MVHVNINQFKEFVDFLNTHLFVRDLGHHAYEFLFVKLAIVISVLLHEDISEFLQVFNVCTKFGVEYADSFLQFSHFLLTIQRLQSLLFIFVGKNGVGYFDYFLIEPGVCECVIQTYAISSVLDQKMLNDIYALFRNVIILEQIVVWF